MPAPSDVMNWNYFSTIELTKRKATELMAHFQQSTGWPYNE
jgi:hypothetical protein